MSLRDRASRATNGVYVGPKAIVHAVYGISLATDLDRR